MTQPSREVLPGQVHDGFCIPRETRRYYKLLDLCVAVKNCLFTVSGHQLIYLQGHLAGPTIVSLKVQADAQ